MTPPSPFWWYGGCRRDGLGRVAYGVQRFLVVRWVAPPFPGWGLSEVGEEGCLGCWGVPCAVGDYLEGCAGILPDGTLGEVGVHPVGADDEGVHGLDLLAFTGGCLGGHPYQGLDVRSSSVGP